MDGSFATDEKRGRKASKLRKKKISIIKLLNPSEPGLILPAGRNTDWQ